MILMNSAMMGAAGQQTGDTPFPDLSDPLWEDCLWLLYGNNGSGAKEWISDSFLALPAGVSLVGDDIYFSGVSSAYFTATGAIAQINLANAATISVMAFPDPEQTDLRLFGTYRGAVESSLLIWRDESKFDTWAFFANNYIPDIHYEPSSFSSFELLSLSSSASGIAASVNGIIVNSIQPSIAFSLIGEIQLGAIFTLSPNYKGHVKFAAVWNRDLSAAEHNQLWNQVSAL